MDMLQANFPDRITTQKTVEELRSLPFDHTFPGDEGDDLDEVERPEEVVQCDDDYLVGVSGMLSLIHVRVELYTKFRNGLSLTMSRYFEWKGLLGHHSTPDTLLERALTDLAHVKPMIARLKAHPELFSDAITRREFFQFASIVITESLMATRMWEKFEERLGQLEQQQHDADVSTPVDPALGVPYTPWQSW
ncbi:hypothetical protein CLAFUR4_14365, partial [Fulvia fulva]